MDPYTFLVIAPFLVGYVVSRLSGNAAAGTAVAVFGFAIYFAFWFYRIRTDIQIQNNELKKSDQRRWKRKKQRSLLVGKRGIAVTDLKMYGECEIDNCRHQSKSGGGLIESGSLIEVVRIDSDILIVKTVN